MSKTLWSRAKGVLYPVAGFGVGWGAFNVAQSEGFISEEWKRRMNISNLKMQLYLQQRVLPASLTASYGYPDALLQSMISSLEKGYTEEEVSNRMTFDDILSQCEMPEQIGYLEEHASEDIPYFYIADIFHSWASIHSASFVKGASSSNSSGDALLLRDYADFDSEILCRSLWDKMLSGVIPFDVSVRALCVLAANNSNNARRLAAAEGPVAGAILDRYEAYRKDIADGKTQADDVVSSDEVTAATLFLLHAINAASVHKQWIPYVGRPSTGPYPILHTIDADQWCRCFSSSAINAKATALAADSALVLADVLCEKLKCPLH